MVFRSMITARIMNRTMVATIMPPIKAFFEKARISPATAMMGAGSIICSTMITAC